MNGFRVGRYALIGATALVLGAGASGAVGASHYGEPGNENGHGPKPLPEEAAERAKNGPAGKNGRNRSENRNLGRLVVGAWLDAEQEVPTPTGDVDDARGKFVAALNRRGKDGMWKGPARLSYEGLSGPAAAAHIHMGEVGEPGAIQVNLCGTAGTPACEDGLRIDLSLTGEQLGALRRGEYYVNVHTEANPPGEIRGQLGVVYRVRAKLTVGQERPRPTRPRRGATGRLLGHLVRYGDAAHLDTKLTYRRLSGPATAGHIHEGARRRIGPPIIPLCGEDGTPDCQSGLEQMHDVDGDTLRALLTGKSYVNVHTAQNPPGEIRGQIRTKLERSLKPLRKD